MGSPLDADSNDPEEQVTVYGQTYHRTQGIIVIEVDDLLGAGSSEHRAKMKWLETKLKFGKIVELMGVKEGTGYAGRRIRQLPDFSYTYSMDEYVRDRLKFVRFERKILKKDALNTRLTADEEQQLRGALGFARGEARWIGCCKHICGLVSGPRSS